MQVLSFNGKSFEYFKIWIVNILLTIITLGLYYPWAKVRTNRYFYANSTLDGRNFEYHATGKQLFFGYLIAMGLLIVYQILAKISPPLAGIMFFVFIFALPWIVWRSMIFGLRMTSFSNVRFGFAGKLGKAYMNYLIYPLGLYLLLAILIAITFFGVKGLKEMQGGETALVVFGVIMGILITAFVIWALAFLKKKNTTYQLSGTRYGQGIFQTQIDVWPLVKYVLLGVLFGLLGYIAFSILAGLILALFVDLKSLAGVATTNPEMMQLMMPTILPMFIAIAYFGLIFVFMLAGSYTITRQRRYIFDNTVLDEKIKFASPLKARSLAWVSLTNFLALILPLAAFYALFAVALKTYGPSSAMTIVSGIAIGFVTVFVVGLIFCWTRVRMARLMLKGTSVDTQIGFEEYVTEKQEQESSLGDQIGDAFNVDIGLGV